MMEFGTMAHGHHMLTTVLGKLFPAVPGKVTKTSLCLFPLATLSCALDVELLLYLKISQRRKLAGTRK